MATTEEVFHYSDIFSDETPDLEKEVAQINMHRAISIICELIQSKNYKISTLTS